MIEGTEFQLNTVSISNFRCFSVCEISLHPELTVLVAENGKGKSAILDAIRISLAEFVNTLSSTQQYGGFVRSDTRLVLNASGAMIPSETTQITADGHVFSQDVQWSLSKRGESQRLTVRKVMAQLLDEAERIRILVQESATGEYKASTVLPLIALYGANRIWLTQSPKPNSHERKMIGEGRMDGYSKCFSASASFADANSWYGERMDEAGDPRFKVLPTYSRPERLVAGVDTAMRIVLEPTGWTDLGWDPDKHVLTVAHPNFGRLPVTLLSDGIRNMIALVVDIARRCATLNPHLSEQSAEKTPGILLIDEVDLHLHPSWQQEIVDLLRKAFPALQMVLTTHSPHVISTVNVESIRTISVRDGRGVVVTPTDQTRGTKSSDVLARIMDVDPIPPVEEAEWLSEYRGLVEQGLAEGQKAQALFKQLTEHFGPGHYAIKELESIARLAKFKETLRTRR